MIKVFNKEISISYLFFVLPLFFFLLIDYGNQVDDIWFLLAHGRYVLNHGIPHTDFLTLHQGLHFVMQQWAFSTILYVIYNWFGSIGVNIFIGIINIIIMFFLYKLCMVISKNNKYFSCIIASIIDLLLELNFIIPRPQIISLLLLIITLYLLEDYLVNKSKKIYFLPLVSILFVNFHAATWPMLFVFCMPFVVEFLYLYIKKKDKRLFKLIVILLISIVTSLINPYGIEALTYSFNSYGNHILNTTIAEMHSFSLDINHYGVFCNSLLTVIVIAVNLIFLKKNYKKYPVHYYFFLVGLSFMAILNIRNITFLLIGTMPFLVLMFNKKVKYKLPVKTYVYLAIPLILLHGINCHRGYYEIRNTNVNKMVEYLDQYPKDKIVLFTYFNDGAYFEYYGYKAYMDPRAEVFFEKNNKKEDIFTEYVNVSRGNIDYDKFIDKYKFTHLEVRKDIKLYDYLKKNKNYKLVCKQKKTYLFERDYSR